MIWRWNKLRVWGVGGTLLALVVAGCRSGLPATGAEGVPAPTAPVLYTACGSIKALAAGPDGSLWAATSGGALCWRPGQALPRRWTVADGLLSNDIRAVAPDAAGATVVTAVGVNHIDNAGTVQAPMHTLNGAEARCAVAVSDDHSPASTLVGTSQGLYAVSLKGWQSRLGANVWRTSSDGHSTWAITEAGLVRLEDGQRFGWPEDVPTSERGGVTALAANEGGVCLATTSGLWRWADGQWRAIALPSGSPASHVSALCARRGDVLAGLYGDGVYRLTPKGWERLPDAPPGCRDVTALAQTPTGIAVGTLSDGIWDWAGGQWRRRALPFALPSADIYSLTGFHGSLWAASFDSGLLRLTNGNVQSITRADGLSSDSPRGLVVFKNTLYARHADGQLDGSSDGAHWHPAFDKAALPRPNVYALATDGRRLLLGGWAGWSAWDGQTWEQHFHDPELQGQVVTAIAAQGDAAWIGTQKRGLLRCANGRYTAFQEAKGLTDDWITCLALRGDRVLVGTYTGGLLEKQGERFTVRLKPDAFAIRAIEFVPGGDTALAATPLGVYREEGPTRWRLLDPHQCGGLETQALLAAPSGVWVASRTGLAFVPE